MGYKKKILSLFKRLWICGQRNLTNLRANGESRCDEKADIPEELMLAKIFTLMGLFERHS